MNQRVVRLIKILFVVGIILLVGAMFDIAPGLGNKKILFWALIAIPTIVISIYCYRIFKKTPTIIHGVIMLVLVIVLNIVGYSLFNTYKDKYYDAIAEKTTEDIYVRLKNVDKDFVATDTSDKVIVTGLDVDVELQGRFAENLYEVEVDKTYDVTVKCSYMLQGEKYVLSRQTQVTFDKNQFPTFTACVEIPVTKTVTATMIVEFERVRSVWDVLLSDLM